MKNMMIGFLLATCMFLLIGWTGYNQGDIACNSVTLIDKDGNVYSNIDKTLIDKINGYDTTIDNMNQLLDFTIKDISQINSELKINKDELEELKDKLDEDNQKLKDDISGMKVELKKDFRTVNMYII